MPNEKPDPKAKPSERDKTKADEIVEEASDESFPASDSPGWIGRRGPRKDEKR